MPNGSTAEEKARRRASRQEQAPPPERIVLAEDCELRRIRGVWYEVRLAPLPEPAYRPYREVQKRRLKPYDPDSRIVEVEITVRRLITPDVRDVVANTMVEAGPAIDDPAAWQLYRRQYPSRHYAIAKRVLSRRELRRHGVSNSASE